MKKKLLLALTLGLILATTAQAQQISVIYTYTGPDNSVTKDDVMGYKAVQTGANTFMIMARSSTLTETNVYQDNVTGSITDMALNVRPLDKSIVLTAMTSSSIYLKGLTLIGTTYNASSNTFNAASGSTFQSMMASKSPHGLGFMVRTSNGSNTTTTAGKINYNGAYVSSVGLAEPASPYFWILSDNDYHYLIYGLADGIYIERRNDDNTLSLNNQFIPYAAAGLSVTHVSQDEFGINIMIRDGNGNLVRKRMFKAGFMTDYASTLNYPIGPNINGDAAIHVSRSVMVLGGTAVKTNDSWTGALTQMNSMPFGGSYSNYRAYALGDHYFITYATGTDGKIKMYLNSMATLQQLHSLTISDGAENVINGFYRENDTTIVVYGYSKDGAITKAKEWVIRIPFDQTVSVQTLKPEAMAMNVYPNPTSDVIHLNNNKHVKEIAISNMVGQPVMRMPVSENATINISPLPSGIYMITGYDGIQRYYNKVIKE